MWSTDELMSPMMVKDTAALDNCNPRGVTSCYITYTSRYSFPIQLVLQYPDSLFMLSEMTYFIFYINNVFIMSPHLTSILLFYAILFEILIFLAFLSTEIIKKFISWYYGTEFHYVCMFMCLLYKFYQM